MIKRNNILLLAILSILIMISRNAYSHKKPKSKKEYLTSKITTIPPRIDGQLNEAVWQQGEWASGFVQRKPNGGAKPSQKTEFKILYDDKNLYVAFKNYDSEPDKIKKLIGQRDQLKGDAVGIAIDSYFDKRTAFEFDVTAAGGKIDMMASEDGIRWDFNWDAVWYAKTSITDWGWIAEIQIPLSQLRFPEKEEQIWGLHVQRRIFRTSEELNWQLIPQDATGMVHLFGELHGIENLKNNKRFEILPYALAKVEFSEKDPENPFATGVDQAFSGGFDAKIGLTSNFTLDLSVNPDFGQVEADPAQLNLTVFETFFPEKRPFFIEGRNMLETDIGDGDLFYSRRIGASPKYCPDLDENEYCNSPDVTSILSSAKITGKTNEGLSIGILESVTTSEYADIIDNSGVRSKEKVEPYTNYLISKVQKDINDGNTVVGGTFTSVNRFSSEEQLDFLNKSSYTTGLSFLHQWKDKTYYIECRSALSNINGTEEAITRSQESSIRYFQRPDAYHLTYDTSRTSLTGYGGTLKIGKQGSGKWIYYERLNWVSPSLDLNDAGFQSIGDNIEQKSILIYRIFKTNKVYNKYQTGLAQFSGWDFGGNNLFYLGETFFSMQFVNMYSFNAGIMSRVNYHSPRTLRGGPMMSLPSYNNFYFTLNTDDRKDLSFQINTSHNKYNDAISQDHRYNFGAYWKVNNAITLSSVFSYMDNITDFQYVTTTDEKYIIANIDRNTASITLRIGAYITPEISLQYYANPYFSVGKYTNFRRIENSLSVDNSKKYHYYTDNVITYNTTDNDYSVVESTTNDTFSFDNPDFKNQQFRSNFVFRWEYKPSSTLYLVWTHSRHNYENIPNYNLNDAVSGLFDIYPDNVFLVKFNYWFSI